MRAAREQAALAPLTVRIPQAAAMLGIGRSTLYLFIASGEIETVKLGRATLVPVDSLSRFIASKRGGSSAG